MAKVPVFVGGLPLWIGGSPMWAEDPCDCCGGDPCTDCDGTILSPSITIPTCPAIGYFGSGPKSFGYGSLISCGSFTPPSGCCFGYAYSGFQACMCYDPINEETTFVVFDVSASVIWGPTTFSDPGGELFCTAGAGAGLVLPENDVGDLCGGTAVIWG